MIYFFGEWKLDPDLYELRRGQRTIRIEPQVFNVLTYLVQHHDRIVSKSELFTHLWPGRHVADSALERCIMSARKAIGESGGKQQMIKTFPRRGYRLIAPVTEVAPTSKGTVQIESVMTPKVTRGELAREGACRSPRRGFAQLPSPQSAVAKLEPQGQSVTVFSCAFVDTSALVETVEIEDVQMCLKSLHEQIILSVQTHDGLLVQFQDDYFLALFGLESQENHAWQALQAALELQYRCFYSLQALKVISKALLPCFGLHTGKVIEKQLDEESPVIYLAGDDTMQFAATLCSCAEPGRILVSEVTYQLIKEVSAGKIVACLAGAKSVPTPMAIYDISQGIPQLR